MGTIFLLADDDSDDTQLFCEALEEIDSSIICYCATDGKNALKLLEDTNLKKPQVIFLDVNMPGMNGWECLKKVKENDSLKHIPVLMYSTTSHHKEVNKALDMGALCFFTKPTYYRDLKEILGVLAAQINGNLLEAISHFKSIHSEKEFSYGDDKGEVL